MTSTRTTPSRTFRVHDVVPATEPLPLVRAHEGLTRLVGFPLEACSDWHGQVVADVSVNPLVQAVHLAFSQHRPLVLGPDVLWTTVLQGIAAHAARDPDASRHSLGVAHPGKARITIERDDLVPGPEAPWVEATEELVAATRAQLGDPALCDLLLRGFSTTGRVERMAQAIAVLDIYRPYCDYVMLCICGIPEITLEGTANDWLDLRGRIDALDELGLERWTPHLRTIFDQFVRAARGDVDLVHWRNIYKLAEAYGAEQVNGWLARLFPYTHDHPNPALELDPSDTTAVLPTPGLWPSVSTESFPLGLSRVAVEQRWRQRWLERTRTVELLGGLVGVAQDEQLRLRPVLGWGVRVPRLETLLERLGRQGTAPDGEAGPRALEEDPFSEGAQARELRALLALFPAGAATHRGRGARLLGLDEAVSRRLVVRRAGALSATKGEEVELREFAVLADGRRLLLDERWAENPFPPPTLLQPLVKAVVTPGAKKGEYRLVARSFEDALEAILASPTPALGDLGLAFEGRARQR